MSQTTHVPGAPYTMTDDDVERFMRAPRRDQHIRKDPDAPQRSPETTYRPMKFSTNIPNHRR